ncbi:MAG: 50S ribosomal protein L23 [Thermaerobacter sp.]|nr:50S ribosomal protein L23 [Thermaerobacter sp.]
MESSEVLVRPIITEKSNEQMALGKYTFRVALTANKPEIKRAVEEIFKVNVLSVHTMRMRGKLRRQGVTKGFRADWKKAIVQLKPGQSIQLFEGV